jgi:hypothetical protein
MSKEPQDKPQLEKLQPEYSRPFSGRFRQTALKGLAYAEVMGKDRYAIAVARKLAQERAAQQAQASPKAESVKK